MKLPPLQPPALPATPPIKPESLPGALRAWQVGAVVEATVSARRDAQTATLRFGSTEIPVRTRVPLTPGETLRARVAAIGEQITLRLLQAPPPASAAVAEATRTALPRQQSIGDLLSNLDTLIAGPTAAPRLPPAVREAARALLGALTEMDDPPDAATLRRAIRESGLFAEARLAAARGQRTPPPERDLKLALIRLLASLYTLSRQLPQRQTAPDSHVLPRSAPPPPAGHQPPVAQPRPPPSLLALLATPNATVDRVLQELIGQAEGALARLQLHQFASLPQQETPGSQVWLLEVPLRHAGQSELFQLRLEQRAGGRPGDTPYWSITVAFELEELGPVRARIIFYEQAVSATLWADRDATTQRFRRHLEALRQRLEKRGLAIRALECVTGIPEEPSSGPTERSGLIDEQA